MPRSVVWQSWYVLYALSVGAAGLLFVIPITNHLGIRQKLTLPLIALNTVCYYLGDFAYCTADGVGRPFETRKFYIAGGVTGITMRSVGYFDDATFLGIACLYALVYGAYGKLTVAYSLA